jgi:hypothetical protein
MGSEAVMWWPFRRRERPEPERPVADVYDRAAENLIAQGIPPRKVRRATAVLKRWARDGVLPEGLVDTGEE